MSVLVNLSVLFLVPTVLILGSEVIFHVKARKDYLDRQRQERQ